MKKKKLFNLTKKERLNVKKNVDFLGDLEEQCKTPAGWKRFRNHGIVDGHFERV